MIDIPFDPNLHLGPATLAWHSLFGLVAIIAGAAIGVALVRPRLSLDQGYGLAVFGVVGGLFGSRVFHVVDEWGRYARDLPAVLAVWNGGASIIGGIVGGALGVVLGARRAGVPLGWVLDGGVVGLAVGMATGRIGDVINGEHHATACAGLAWCVRYTHPDSPGQRDYVHPAVAYELLADLVIAAILYGLRRRGALRDGLLFVFLALYGPARFALGAVRLDPPFALGLTEAQLSSIAFALVGAAGVVATARRARVGGADGGR